MRKPLSWNQHWLPRAYKAGVEMVNGDHYYAARSQAMGIKAYYSEKLSGWVYIHPGDAKQYSLWDLGWTPAPDTRDNVAITAVRIRHRLSQEELAEEFAMLALQGADDKSRRADGKQIHYIVEQQEKAAMDVEETVTTAELGDPVVKVIVDKLYGDTETSRMNGATHLDDLVPVSSSQLNGAKAPEGASLFDLAWEIKPAADSGDDYLVHARSWFDALTAAGKELRELRELNTELSNKVWEWLTKVHFPEWEFTDQEKDEVAQKFTEFTGIHAPTSSYLVQVNVPQGMTPEQLRELLRGNKIEVSEIS